MVRTDCNKLNQVCNFSKHFWRQLRCVGQKNKGPESFGSVF